MTTWDSGVAPLDSDYLDSVDRVLAAFDDLRAGVRELEEIVGIVRALRLHMRADRLRAALDVQQSEERDRLDALPEAAE